MTLQTLAEGTSTDRLSQWPTDPTTMVLHVSATGWCSSNPHTQRRRPTHPALTPPLRDHLCLEQQTVALIAAYNKHTPHNFSKHMRTLHSSTAGDE